jgi:uncharacterized cupredoxin-like copper-binding protein
MTAARLGTALVSFLVLSAASGLAPAGAGSKGHNQRAFAAGEPGDPRKPSRVIEVTMGEGDGKMFYRPDRVEVKRGEQIRFVLKNDGELDHEFMLDTVERNRKHAELMRMTPEMEHDDPNGKLLKAKTGADLLWRFTKPGTFEFACFHPGHYESGMKGVVVVTPAKAAPAAKSSKSPAK